MNRYEDMPPTIEPPVPLPHEHQFVIQTETWSDARRGTVTLRFCSLCGLTHALFFTTNDHFIWEEVKERMVP